MILGIDASNIRGGGGVTHLAELLRAAEPKRHGFEQVVVWAPRTTLERLIERAWLIKRDDRLLERGWLCRLWWQRNRLGKLLRGASCTLLFVPGGSFVTNFRPIVTMSRNLLPFQWAELRRYPVGLVLLRLLLLRWIQSCSFRRADAVVFLTRFAKETVLGLTGNLKGRTTIIPHGVHERFYQRPRAQRPLADYHSEQPFRLLYVSIVNVYKHQWHVAEAVATLRKEGVPVTLDLVGPAYSPALRRLEGVLRRIDPAKNIIRYHGEIPYTDLHHKYNKADLGIFASSCENMPNILLETMGAGLPIACSNRGPMPEVLGNAGVYFDPEDPDDIASALRKLIDSPDLRARLAKSSFERAQAFSWRRCASETFGFLTKVARTHSTSSLTTVRA